MVRDKGGGMEEREVLEGRTVVDSRRAMGEKGTVAVGEMEEKGSDRRKG